MAESHLQLNADGTTATRKTTLWPSSKPLQQEIIKSIFEQQNWHVTSISNINGSHWKIETECGNFSWKVNLFISSIRDESRQPDEFKMQLGNTYPEREEEGWVNLVLGIYTVDDGVNPVEYILSGYAVDRYDFSSNPSIRGTRTSGLQKAKVFGMFMTDKSVLFRPEFLYYYIETQAGKQLQEGVENADNNNDDKQLPLQQITYGAPGTGKSHGIKKETAGKSVIRTTFHPDSDYSTFVGAYKPTSVEVPVMTIIGKEQIPVVNANPEKKIVYEFVPQAFLKAYTGAWKNQDEPFFLIIEEINRGNCAQIFGDLFQLLDRNDETGLSDYPISPDEDIQKFLLTDKKYGFAALTDAQKAAIPIEVQSGELMILPKNLHIWATMNTSDQSLFPIDSAFKRRWDWQYMPISDGKKGWQIAVNGKCYDWWQFLQKMNDKIGSTTNSEDKKLGYFFCKAKNGIIDAETFVGKVVFYIWNDVFKDFAEEAGDLFKDIEGILTFNKFYTIGVDRKAKVVEEKVERLLQNLGVDEIGEYHNVGEEVIDDTESASRRVLNVEFEDETIAIKRFPQYLQVLQKIGLDKAEAVASEKQVDVLGCALVSKNKEETIEESQYSYVEVDGYFVVKGIKGKVMMNFLPLISDKYSLNLKIAYK